MAVPFSCEKFLESYNEVSSTAYTRGKHISQGQGSPIHDHEVKGKLSSSTRQREIIIDKNLPVTGHDDIAHAAEILCSNSTSSPITFYDLNVATFDIKIVRVTKIVRKRCQGND